MYSTSGVSDTGGCLGDASSTGFGYGTPSTVSLKFLYADSDQSESLLGTWYVVRLDGFHVSPQEPSRSLLTRAQALDRNGLESLANETNPLHPCFLTLCTLATAPSTCITRRYQQTWRKRWRSSSKRPIIPQIQKTFQRRSYPMNDCDEILPQTRSGLLRTSAAFRSHRKRSGGLRRVQGYEAHQGGAGQGVSQAGDLVARLPSKDCTAGYRLCGQTSIAMVNSVAD